MDDTLRLAVEPVDLEEFQVEVFINGAEMTAAAAGRGMTPGELLTPVNRLVATAEPHTVPIARCDCGDYRCGGTEVTIVRDGDRVRWEWSGDLPMSRPAVFAADEYDAEMVRVGDLPCPS